MNLTRTRTRRQGPCYRRCETPRRWRARRSYCACLSPRHHLWGGAHGAQTDGGASYDKQAGEEARPVSKLDPTKALKVSASPKPRSKGRVFGAIAQRGGVHPRDVATVFDVMGSLIKAALPALSGSPSGELVRVRGEA